MNSERKVNILWAHGEHFVNSKSERSGERKWTNSDHTVNTWKNGKVERFRDCMHVTNIH